ncbi:MAG: alpha/beta hydrolase [Oscillospiraceae bacterium]|nr:alpha/beta hydrolase [Oscillospiraceae bacterium]
MIYYEKYGNDSNPIILCLHGMNFVHSFSKQSDQLSKNYCLMIPHLPGFGRNSQETFSAELAVSQIAEFAESLGRKVTLMGFALGAQLCLPLICDHGEYFNGAIMVSPWLIKSMQEVEKLMKQQSDNEKLSKNKLKIGLDSIAIGLDKGERQEHEEYCKNVSMNSILAAIDNGLQLDDYPSYDQVDMPLLALCGIKEPLDIRKSVRDLARRNPHCEYDMWDGAANNIPFKFASRFNKTVEEFMAKVK